SLDEAIAFAKNRVLIARAVEAEAAQRASAKDATGILVEFKECGRALDEAFRVVAERGQALGALLSKLHTASGGRFPSHDQLDALGYAALQTAIGRTVWGRRFRPQQPVPSHW